MERRVLIYWVNAHHQCQMLIFALVIFSTVFYVSNAEGSTNCFELNTAGGKFFLYLYIGLLTPSVSKQRLSV